MGVNDVILDRTVRHQVGLQRLATGTARDLNAVLNQFDNKLIPLIAKIDAGMSVVQVERVLRDIKKVNAEAYAAVGAEIRRRMLDTAKYETAYQGALLSEALRRDVLRKLGLRGPSTRQLENAVSNHAINGALLGEYVEGMAEGRFRRMRDAIRAEHRAGGPGVADGIRRAIVGSSAAHYDDGVLGLSRRSMEQATRTVQSGIVSASRELLYAENNELFHGEMWVSVLDMKTSDKCQKLDGTIFPIGEGPRPPAHPNCRSTTTPVVKDWKALGLDDLGPGTRESMDGEVPETMTYPEWLSRQSAEVQDEVLGPTRGKLYREEGVQLDRFTDDAGRRYTLEELSQREGVSL